jgi:hypothetical protein
MLIEAKLVFQHYVPTEYTSLMFLAVGAHKTPYVYSIEGLRNPEAFMEVNGYPVKPYIIDEGNPNLSNSTEILATPEQIGWFDAGPDSEDLVDIEIRQFNDILEFDNGYVLIEVDDHTDEIVLFQDKVTLMYVDSLDDVEDEDYNPDNEIY